MNSYKGFTPEERMANLRRVKAAIAEGTLENPNNLKCEICGQDKGIREYHCTDYTPERALNSLQCLCFKCHRNLHIVEKVEETGEMNSWYGYAKYYFDQVEKGRIFDPVYYKSKKKVEIKDGN